MTCYHWKTCEWKVPRRREGWSRPVFPQVEQIKSIRNNFLKLLNKMQLTVRKAWMQKVNRREYFSLFEYLTLFLTIYYMQVNIKLDALCLQEDLLYWSFETNTTEFKLLKIFALLLFAVFYLFFPTKLKFIIFMLTFSKKWK